MFGLLEAMDVGSMPSGVAALFTLATALALTGAELPAQASARTGGTSDGPCATFPATADTSAEIMYLYVSRVGPRPRRTKRGVEAEWRAMLGLVAQEVRSHLAPPAALPLVVSRATRLTSTGTDTLHKDWAVPDLGARVDFTLYQDGRVTAPVLMERSSVAVIDTMLVHGLERSSGQPGLRDVLAPVAQDSARLVLELTNKAPPDANAPFVPFFRALVPRYRYQGIMPDRDNSRPKYPLDLWQARVSGDVVLSFVVDSTGKADPLTVRVLRPTYRQFFDAVMREMPGWLYRPATANGCPVAQRAEQSFNFRVR